MVNTSRAHRPSVPLLLTVSSCLTIIAVGLLMYFSIVMAVDVTVTPQPNELKIAKMSNGVQMSFTTEAQSIARVYYRGTGGAWIESPISNGTSHKITIDSFQPSVKYSFYLRIVAQGAGATEAWQSNVFKMEETPSLWKPEVTRPLGSSYITIVWGTPLKKTKDAHVHFRKKPAPGAVGSEWAIMPLDAALKDIHKITLRGLSANTQYQFFVSSFEPEAKMTYISKSGDKVNGFKTANATTPVVTLVGNPLVLQSTRATISWLTDQFATTQLKYGPGMDNLNVTTTITDTENSMKDVHTVHLGSLQPDTTYYYKAFSKDAFNYEGSSPVKSFKTLQAGMGALPVPVDQTVLPLSPSDSNDVPVESVVEIVPPADLPSDDDTYLLPYEDWVSFWDSPMQYLCNQYLPEFWPCT